MKFNWTQPVYQKKWFLPLIIVVGLIFTFFTIKDVKKNLNEITKSQKPTTTKELETGDIMVGGNFSTDTLSITVEKFKETTKGSIVTVNFENLDYEVTDLSWKDVKIIDPNDTELDYKVIHKTDFGDDKELHLPAMAEAKVIFAVDKATAKYFKVSIEGYDTATWDLSKKE